MERAVEFGGRALTGYTVLPSPAAPSAVYEVVGAQARITGLSNGTRYTFRVLATTPVGDGPASAPSNGATPLAPPTGLAYATNPAIYTLGSAIAPNAPSAGGGTVAAYSVAPALPPGLSLDASTGVVTGAPTALQAVTPYTVTASNTGGSTTADLRITVNDVAPRGLTYSLPSWRSPWKHGLATVPSTSGGGRVVSWTVSPPLPAASPSTLARA